MATTISFLERVQDETPTIGGFSMGCCQRKMLLHNQWIVDCLNRHQLTYRGCLFQQLDSYIIVQSLKCNYQK